MVSVSSFDGGSYCPDFHARKLGVAWPCALCFDRRAL